MSYALLDSGDGLKWERFGEAILCRPCPQAMWRRQKQVEPDALFAREERWTFRRPLPEAWEVECGGLRLRIAPTEFGHLGLFPEHRALWTWVREHLAPGMRFLNLFAYSGAATLAAAQAGASVCHLDAAKGMVDWARDNAARNNLAQAPIRWIVDDAMKFLKREIKRGSHYEAILLDPPSFGRGSKGEVFKIERDLVPLLEMCRALLSDRARFCILSCHTPGLGPLVLRQTLEQLFARPAEAGEMLLEGDGFSVPSGAFARVLYDH